MLAPREIWDRLGGGDNPPPKLGRYRGALVVMGGGRCIWGDIDALKDFSAARIAVNEIGMHYPGRLDHWLTLHPEYMPGWRLWRANHCMGEGYVPQTHSHIAAPGIDHAWSGVHIVGGTGGLAAGIVGLLLGYAPVIFAGVPMDNSGHYFDPPSGTTPEFGDGAVRSEWAQAIEIAGGRFKSMSGNTRLWCGAPDFMKAATLAQEGELLAKPPSAASPVAPEARP